MASKSLDDLHPQTRTKVNALLSECARVGLLVRITCTFRSMAEQAALYAQGRTKPGTIVTKARPGSSFHNVRRAMDVLILTAAGKVDWEWMDSLGCAPLWLAFGRAAKEAGLEWGGNWTTIQDRPHVEDRWCATCRERVSSALHFEENGECKNLVEG